MSDKLLLDYAYENETKHANKILDGGRFAL